MVVCLASLTAAAQAPARQAEPTVVIEGQVVDLRGEPVPTPKVTVSPCSDRARVVAQTVGDGEGFFRLGHLASGGSWIVRADCSGRCVGETVASGAKPVCIRVHDAATVRGVLRDQAGAPAASVLVRAELCDQNLHTRVDATTDAAGRFELPRVPLGPVRLAAVVPGQGLATFRTLVTGDTNVEFAPAQRATTDLEITVEGVPKDALGKVWVTILPLPEERSLARLPPPWDREKLDAHGKFELHTIPNWSYQVGVEAAGYTITPRYAIAKINQGPHRLRFQAEAAVAAEARYPAVVRDWADKAVPGLRLRLAGGSSEGEAVSDDKGSLVFAVPLIAGSHALISSLDDRYVLDQDKAEDRGTLDVSSLARHECRLDPGKPLQLRVAAASSARGRVLLPDGRPAAFADVALEEFFANRGPQWCPFARATTDREGNYGFQALHHFQRPVRVRVETRAGAGTSEELALPEPGTRLVFADLKLEVPATVEGTVVDERGRPTPGIRVWLREWDSAARTAKMGQMVEVITDRQGRWRFTAVPPGTAWLQVLVEKEMPTEGAVEPFQVEAGQRYAFELPLPKIR
jgi:protocatechuate 3,4-dioxygenase beta subunit